MLLQALCAFFHPVIHICPDRKILLNYATYNRVVGYNQGMSDLLASVLAIVQDEVDAFWCFVGLMEGSVFVTSPKDDVMDRQLVSSNKYKYF